MIDLSAQSRRAASHGGGFLAQKTELSRNRRPWRRTHPAARLSRSLKQSCLRRQRDAGYGESRTGCVARDVRTSRAPLCDTRFLVERAFATEFGLFATAWALFATPCDLCDKEWGRKHPASRRSELPGLAAPRGTVNPQSVVVSNHNPGCVGEFLPGTAGVSPALSSRSGRRRVGGNAAVDESLCGRDARGPRSPHHVQQEPPRFPAVHRTWTDCLP